MMRIGQGFDVHALVEGRPLIIGGVTIPFERGPAIPTPMCCCMRCAMP
jgi:2-C-methyl-D-erythritol 2,4-cyclodiphosphate synthase